MGTIQGSNVIDSPRSQPPAPSFEAGSDGQLLQRFIARADDAAFEELVRRHAAMVLGVCQRILHNRHDAEDCFQAAFLVLARKAESVRPREMVGNWLYGVAYRTALEARKMAARRREMERKVSHPNAREGAPDPWHELRGVLDQELQRLPDKYRVLLIACDIEGKTRKEMARQLRLPQGTVASRLARGRTLLSNRLARRRLSFSVAALALILSENAAPAAVPDWLIESTATAAAQLAAGDVTVGIISSKVVSLAESVLKSMLLARLKLAGAALFLFVLLGLGIGAFIPAARAERKMEAKKADTGKPTAAKPQEPGNALAPADKKETVDPDKGTFLQAMEEKVQGVVKLIDANLFSLSIVVPDAEFRVETIEVAKDVAVMINGRKGTLADVRVGMSVTLRLSGEPGRRTVVGIMSAHGKTR
jgi:RNA polymerase sigma factor (sigma-70 family)